MTMKDGFGLKRKDWKADPRVRLLSLALRGLYIELAAWAMDSARRGYLVQNGAALGWVDLARLVNCSVDELRHGMEALRVAGLVELCRDGVFMLPVIVRAAAKSEKMRINALAGAQPNLFQNNDKTEVAEQKPESNVISITSPPPQRRESEKRSGSHIYNNKYKYIYSKRVQSDDPDDPEWFNLSVIKFRKSEYEALLSQLPVDDARLMDMLAKQNAWLENNPGYAANWLAPTLKYLRLVTGGGKAVAA